MNHKKNNTSTAKIAVATLLGLATLGGMTLPAYAATASSTAAREARQTANEATRIEQIKTAANKEIDRRTASLNDLSTRIGEMKHESDASKASLTTMIQGQLTEMATIKAKIAADTDLTTLKTDVQSITKSYRIYMLIIPSARIDAAADRIMTIADEITAIGVKLQTRITAAGAAGNDVSKLTAALTDMNAKLADAKVQAQAAIAGIAGLTPDGGDKTKMDANNAALKAAHEKIKAGEADLKAARADIKTIVQGLKATKSTATTTSVTN